MPPPWRNQRAPTADDTPTAAAASSVVTPVAITRQNARSTSRRTDGAPGDFISDRPVSSFIHPAGRPIDTSNIEVLQRPVESAQYLSGEYQDLVRGHGMRQSVGRTGVCWDNSVAESFWSSLKRELVHRYRFRTRAEARRAIFAWINRYNTSRLHSSLGNIPPTEWEANYSQPQAQQAA